MIRSSACQPWHADIPSARAGKHGRLRKLHHYLGVRHAKLIAACGCKSHPAKPIAGKPGPSLAGIAVTRGLKW